MLLEIIFSVILLCASAFFSCSETALTSLPKHQASYLKKRKVKGAK
ncbi:MAG: CNNM domain-containing protein, partial [Candidatus Margulisbacteria bacterium]|nr:CNNM domain-containing protein [Candidatus Margulisiibacteriota bacterium]